MAVGRDSSLPARRKKGKKFMLKTFVSWIVPLLVLTLIAAYLLVTPMMRTHAAAPIAPSDP